MADIFKKKLQKYLYETPGIKSSIMQANHAIDQYLNINPGLKNNNYFGLTIEGKINFYEKGKIDFKEILEFYKKNKRKVHPVKIDVNRISYNFNYIDNNSDLQLAYHSKRENYYKDLDSYPYHKHTGPNKNDYTGGNKLISLDEFINEVEENEF